MSDFSDWLDETPNGQGSVIDSIERNLSKQEMEIVKYHRDTIAKGQVGRDSQGRPVTVYSNTIQTPDGRYVTVPGYYDGKITDDQEALLRKWGPEIAAGKWPIYDDPKQADSRAKYIHGIMEVERDGKPAEQQSDFARWLTGQDEDAKLTLSMQEGLARQPERATRILQLQTKTGLPKAFIDENLDVVEQHAAKQDFNPGLFKQRSRSLAAWIAEHPDHAAAAKPDLPALSYIERQFRYISGQYERGNLTTELADIGNLAMAGAVTPEQRTRQAEIERVLALQDTSDITGFFEQIPGQVAQQIPIQLRSIGGKVKAAGEGTLLGASAGAAAGAATANPALPAAGAALGAFSGWRYGAAIEAGKLEASLAYLDYEKLKDEQGNPLDKTTALGLAGIVGVVNGALEGLTGLERATDKLPWVRNFSRDGLKQLLASPSARDAVMAYAKTVGSVMVAEGVTEAVQSMVTNAGKVILKSTGSPTDILGELFSNENIQQAIQEGRAGAQGGGGLGAVVAAPALVTDLRAAKQAKQNEQLFLEIGKATESTKMREALPEHLQAIIAAATKDGPIETVYLPTDAFNTYFQGQGVDPRQVAEAITGSVETYDQAVQTGQDLPIKTADYAAKIAGTPHNAFFAKELRTSLDAMNAREAEEWAAAMTERETAAAEQAGLDVANDPAGRVRQQIAGQLQAAGLSPTVADLYAGLYESRYRARAERRGLGETAADLFNRLNLTVTKQIPEVLRTLGGKISELDALLNRLRVGDLPKPDAVFGQSLTNFLKEKGGLQDQGGELSARNLDDTRTPFGKKLIQEQGLTLDQAAELAAESGYLEQRDLGALLDALDKDARGTPVYAPGRENAALLDVQHNLDSLKAFLADRGIDLAQTSNEQVKALLGEAIQQPLPGVEGQTFAQPAYHGSPHIFDQFSLHAIGSGEGAQAYGWGLYFSSQKKIAQWYRKTLGGESGRLYKVDIPEDGTLLDWDDLIVNQSDTIQQALDDIMRSVITEINDIEDLEKEWSTLTGKDIYTLLSTYISPDSDPKAISLKLSEAGIDGIKYKGDASGATNFVIFDDKLIRIMEFEQSAENDAKGSITFGDNQVNIKLLEKADLSTFIHETGHLYLNELIDDATTEGVPQQLRDDLDTVLKWMGLEVTSASGKDAIKAAVQTVHHEQFARGFEAYTMEGTAPSQALREIFATFRQWLIQVYRSLTTGPLQVKLTKQVREVMDRMIATDDAIDAAAAEAEVVPIFTDAESAGMTPTQWQAYQALVAKASTTSRETLQAKLMRQYQRTQQQWWKDKRMAVLDTVTREVNEEPEYIALAVLKTGKMPDGSDIPHGIPPMKLDKKGLAETFGKDFLKRLPKGLTAKDGMHHDAVAQLFGYSNGQEFVMALVNARPKTELIEAETDRRMQEEYGDLRFDGTIAEEAKAAVLNEFQEQVIAAELKAINQKRREVAPFVKAAETEAQAAQQQGRNLLSTMTPTLEETRTLARNIMSRMALKAIQANRYSITARQASRKATAALAKQDYVNAGHYKQQELLNLALYREAGMVTERIESARELAKSFFKADATLAKSRNVDLVNVGRAILAQYGLGTDQPKTAAEYLDPIKKYDQDLYDQWKPQVDALAPRPIPFTALTVEEFTKLADDLDALWLLSRRTQQAKIDGQLMDRADLIEQLTAELDAKTTAEKTRILGDQTKWEDAKLGLMSWGSALRRVESWVDVMDGGNINGIFRRFIWNPIAEASVTFRTEKAKLLKQYLTIIQPIESTMSRDLIPANELGQGFAFRGKAALLHAILHTGNESNKAKLLKGYGWDASQWDAFLTRAWQDGLVTKADYDYAQGVWDLLESIKPQAQQAHHEMYGYYFNEITASPIQTPWGEYKGGYVPAIADSVKSVDQAIRQEKDLFDQGGNSFMFPTTGRGFTKARVEQYAAPLALNLAAIPIHLDKVMRFVHLEPRVKDAARLVTNKQLRASLDGYNPTIAKDMLVPWLQRSAQQTVSSPGKNRHADRLFRYLRGTVGAQIMVGNVVNTLQQFTGFSLSLIKVKATYLRGGLATYLKGPGAMAESIHAKSPFMAQRMTTQVMDIQQSIDEIILNPTKYEKAKDFAKAHGYFLQQGTQNVVDLITWSGAYDQAVQGGADERDAVRSADAAVRQTQGSFDPESLSAFESGTPFVRAFTMFYSYFNMQANLLGAEFQKVAQEMGLKKGAGRAFFLYVVGFLIPAVLAETIVSGLGGFDPDDEDGYLNESLSVLFGSQIRSALAFFPGVGPVALAGINAFNSKWYDDRISTSPVVALIESAARAPHSLYQAMSEEGHSKRAIRDVLTLLGLVTGTPASALNRPLGYLADVYDGVATPENAVDVGRGLISGKDVNRTK